MAARRLLVSESTGDKIREQAKRRGVTILVYLDWLIKFIEDNPIDEDASLENRYFPHLRKEIDRVISIIRRIEKDQLLPTALGVKALTSHLAEIVPEDNREESNENVTLSQMVLEMEQVKSEAAKVPQLRSENQILKERLSSLLRSFKANRWGGGGVIELTTIEVNQLQELL